jgi:hypothetical protein
MAKVARQAVVKKASKAMPAPLKPVKQVLTRSALVDLIAEENEIPRKTAAGVYATLENLFLGSVHPRGVGEFVPPGLLSAQGSGAQSRHPHPRPFDRRNGRSGGQTGGYGDQKGGDVDSGDKWTPCVDAKRQATKSESRFSQISYAQGTR